MSKSLHHYLELLHKYREDAPPPAPGGDQPPPDPTGMPPEGADPTGAMPGGDPAMGGQPQTPRETIKITSVWDVLKKALGKDAEMKEKQQEPIKHEPEKKKHKSLIK